MAGQEGSGGFSVLSFTAVCSCIFSSLWGVCWVGVLHVFVWEGAPLPPKLLGVKSTVLKAQHEKALRDIHSRDVQFITQL